MDEHSRPRDLGIVRVVMPKSFNLGGGRAEIQNELPKLWTSHEDCIYQNWSYGFMSSTKYFEMRAKGRDRRGSDVVIV